MIRPPCPGCARGQSAIGASCRFHHLRRGSSTNASQRDHHPLPPLEAFAERQRRPKARHALGRNRAAKNANLGARRLAAHSPPCVSPFSITRATTDTSGVAASQDQRSRRGGDRPTSSATGALAHRQTICAEVLDGRLGVPPPWPRASRVAVTRTQRENVGADCGQRVFFFRKSLATDLHAVVRRTISERAHCVSARRSRIGARHVGVIAHSARALAMNRCRRRQRRRRATGNARAASASGRTHSRSRRVVCVLAHAAQSRRRARRVPAPASSSPVHSESALIVAPASESAPARPHRARRPSTTTLQHAVKVTCVSRPARSISLR